MHKFKTPHGTTVDVNDNSYKWALALGWEEIKDKPKPTPKPKAAKRGNSTDSN